MPRKLISRFIFFSARLILCGADVYRPVADIGEQQQAGTISALYDSIGINYAELRKPDPRIAKTIDQALEAANVVLNVGAGTGSYEPADRQLVAVEPSLEMIRKRGPSAAKAIQAFADDLPFEDGSFEGSMAILTVHHWRKITLGRVTLEVGEVLLAELAVARGRPGLCSAVRSSTRRILPLIVFGSSANSSRRTRLYGARCSRT